jgi:hypothetical protein
VADFQAPDALSNWDYDPSAWQIVNDAGERILVGQASLRQPMVVLGLQTPAWTQPNPAGLVLAMRFNLDAQAAGARLVFQYSQTGYYVFEVFPGLMVLRRSAARPDIFFRDGEQILRQLSAPITANQWHSVTIWVDGSRIFVYLDRQLYVNAEDLTQPQLSAGQVLLQTNSTTRPARFDDLVIRRAELPSSHFQGAALPTNWQYSDMGRVSLAQETGGNQFMQMRGEVEARPALEPLTDVSVICRIYSFEGGYQLRLRDSAGGAMLFDFNAGSLTISQLDRTGGVVRQESEQNIYNRGRWENWQFDLIGDRVEVYRDGSRRYQGVFSPAPGEGTIAFIGRRADIFALDDCLIMETATSSNIDARAFLGLRTAVDARPFRLLRSDLDENFDDIFRTDDWWIDGRSAAGDFVSLPTSADHRFFLRMTDLGRPTWRMIRDVIGVALFGAGTDRRTFADSTDLRVTVEMRFPMGAMGTAWLGARTSPTITGANLNGYRLELRRERDSTTTVVVRALLPNDQQIVYEGPLPAAASAAPDAWIPVEIVANRDLIGFFVAGEFITSINDPALLGGTVALGVETGTTADFDTLLIRDLSPHGE